MKRRAAHLLLFTLPASGALLYVALTLATGDDRLAYLVLREAALALATVACVAAALAFHRGEYLWWAWASQAVTYGLGVLDNLLPAAAAGSPAGGWADAGRLLLYAVLNVAGVAGALLFALATLRGGLGLPGSRPLQAAVLAATVAVALALTAPTVRLGLAQLAAGQPPIDVATDLLSALSDGLCFLLGAPLLVIAVALRGSALATTFWLLAASNTSWLLSDELCARARTDARWAIPGHALLVAACLATAAAAWAHRRAARAAAHPANEPSHLRAAG